MPNIWAVIKTRLFIEYACYLIVWLILFFEIRKSYLKGFFGVLKLLLYFINMIIYVKSIFILIAILFC